MPIDEQPMNVYWSGKRTETSNNFKTSYKGSVATKNDLPSLNNKTGDMYNVAESGENFIWNGDSWDSLSGDTLKTLNWQKSEKAGTVAIYPVSETVLYPVVEFAFTETDPVEGDKSPNNPSTLTGVNSVKVTRTGKNLLYYPYNQLTRTSNGITFTANKDGTVTINGTCEGGSYFSVCDAGLVSSDTSTKMRLVRGLPYMGSLNIVSGSFSGNLWFSGSNGAGGGNPFAEAITPQNPSALIDWTGTGAAENLRFFLAAGSGAVFNSLRVAPQLELGSTVTTFESYEGSNYIIDLGGTFYGGFVDFSTGLMTVTHATTFIDGDTAFATSGFAEYDSTYKLQLTLNPARSMAITSSDIVSNRLPVFASTPSDSAGIYFPSASSLTHFVLSKTDINVGDEADRATVTAAYNSFFTNHPTTVIYPLATPYTLQLTPTEIISLVQTDKYAPRLNTVYSDAQAVQVGYAKSPIRSEYELIQAITAIEGSE